MTQEDKELLLKDICARLSYKMFVKTAKGVGYVYAINTSQLIELSVANDSEYWSEVFNIDEIKLYLRPMSSMTEEERKELVHLVVYVEGPSVIKQIKDGGLDIMEGKYQFHSLQVLDWLNARHFDYRGLLEKGLALPAPEGMY